MSEVDLKGCGLLTQSPICLAVRPSSAGGACGGMGTEVTVPVTIRAAAAGAAAAADGADTDVMKSCENRPLPALELAAASGRSVGCSSGWYFDSVL